MTSEYKQKSTIAEFMDEHVRTGMCGLACADEGMRIRGYRAKVCEKWTRNVND